MILASPEATEENSAKVPPLAEPISQMFRGGLAARSSSSCKISNGFWFAVKARDLTAIEIMSRNPALESKAFLKVIASDLSRNAERREGRSCVGAIIVFLLSDSI
jgi:hypothetical protein